jgi:hypothetical protein
MHTIPLNQTAICLEGPLLIKFFRFILTTIEAEKQSGKDMEQKFMVNILSTHCASRYFLLQF